MQLLSNSRVLLEMTTPTERGFYTILSSILFFSSYFFLHQELVVTRLILLARNQLIAVG